MILTIEAYRERKWGYYPELRMALEDKQVPSFGYGFTSAFGNMFNDMRTLIEVAALIDE